MPRSDQLRPAEQAAGRYLEWLLRHVAAYRMIWTAKAHDLQISVAARDPNDFSQDAVAAVWADYLYKYKIDDWTKKELALYRKGERVKHQQISRALKGAPLSEKTLTGLIRAFDIKGEHERRLWRIWHGEEHAPIVMGELITPTNLPRYDHETISIDEDHYLGPDGLPAWHETRQTIRSRVDNLTYFPYRIDTPELDVTLLHGGTQNPIAQVTEGLWEVPFVFHKPARLGDIRDFRYRVDFRYNEPPAPSYNRRVYGHYDGWHLHLFFHPERLPRQVWWTEWANDQDDSPIKRDEPVELDDDRSVHRHLLLIKGAVAGFRWRW